MAAVGAPHASADVTAAFVRRLGAEYARGECMTWAVCERRRDRFMGMISFIAVCAKCRSGEIGYWLGEPYWNRGYMTEALRMVVGFGFDRMRLHRVWAAYIVGNPASGRVMQKAGMRFEGIGRGEILHQGLFCDLAHYAIVKE